MTNYIGFVASSDQSYSSSISNRTHAAMIDSASHAVLFGSGAVQAGEFDALIGATLSVGTTNATGITIGSSGMTTTIAGDLSVTGTRFINQSTDVLYTDRYLQLNQAYTTVSAVSAGLISNYLPTATTDDTTGAGNFTAGVDGVSDPTVTTQGAATFSAADIIMISGSNLNDGIYEVQGHAANVLTIKSTANGVTNQVEDFTQNQFQADTGDTGAAITKVNVTIIRTGTDGDWEVGKGATTGITYNNLATTAGITLQAAYDSGQTITLVDSSGDMIFTLDDTGTAADFSVTDSGGDYITTDAANNTLDLGSAANTVDFLGAVTSTGNSTWNFGTGQADFDGNLDANAGLDVTSGTLTHTGGNIDLDPTGTFTLDMDASQTATITMADNLADAFLVKQNGNAYIDCTTTDAAEAINLGNATTNPDLNFVGSGTITQSGGGLVTFNGSIDANAGIDIQDNQSLTLGTGDDFNMFHNGTDTILDNTHVTGTTAARLGTDTAATSFEVQNNSQTPQFTVTGAGQATFAGNVDATNGLDVTTAALTAAAGITQTGGAFTFSGSNLDLDPTGTFDLSMDAAQTCTFNIADNLANAFLVQETANDYIAISTANAAEAMDFGNATTNPAFDFLGSGTFTQSGSGQATFNGNVDATNGLDVSGGDLTATGGDFNFTGTNVDWDPTGNIDIAMDSGQTITVTAGDSAASAFLVQNSGGEAFLEVNTTASVLITDDNIVHAFGGTANAEEGGNIGYNTTDEELEIQTEATTTASQPSSGIEIITGSAGGATANSGSINITTGTATGTRGDVNVSGFDVNLLPGTSASRGDVIIGADGDDDLNQLHILNGDNGGGDATDYAAELVLYDNTGSPHCLWVDADGVLRIEPAATKSGDKHANSIIVGQQS